MILLGNLEIVHAMPLCNFDVIVVTEFAVHVDLLMRFLLTRFLQVPAETATCCSLKDHGGISKQLNSKTAQERWFMAHIRNMTSEKGWHGGTNKS